MTRISDQQRPSLPGPRQVGTGRDTAPRIRFLPLVPTGTSVSPTRWDDPYYGARTTAGGSRLVAAVLLARARLVASQRVPVMCPLGVPVVSYDIWLEVDVGGTEMQQLDTLPDWNYTSNVSQMWRLAMPQTDGLAGMEGMPCSEAAVHLRAGIAAMEKHTEEYRALNPANGWGDFEGQLEALHELLAACEKAPNAQIGICR